MYNNPNFFKIFLIFLILSVGVFASHLLPYLLVFSIIVSIPLVCKNDKIRINLIDILFVIFLFSLSTSYLSSINKCNTEHEILKIFSTIIIYLLFRVFFNIDYIKNRFIIFFCSCLAVILCLNLFFLINYSTYFQLAGFKNLISFRDSYRPFGIILNDWVGILMLSSLIVIFGISEFIGNHKIKFYLFILLSCIIFLILTTFSRAGIYSLAFIIVLCSLFIPSKLIFDNYKTVILILLSITLSVIIFPEEVLTTLKLFETTSQKLSFSGRISTWEHSINILNDKSFLGIGSGNYPLASCLNRDYNIISTARISNIFLQILVENGATGLLFFLALISIVLFSNIKKYYLTQSLQSIIFSVFLIGFLIREFFFNSLLSNFIVLLLFTIVIAFNTSNINIKSFKISPTLFFSSLVVLSIVSCILNFRINKAQNLNEKGLQLFNNEKFLESIVFFKKANEYRSGNAVYLSNIATAYERLSNIDNSINSIIRNKGDIKFNLLDSSQVYLKKALSINPNDDAFLHNLGWLFLMQKDLVKAEYYFNKAIKYDPSVAYYYISRGLVFYKDCKIDFLYKDFSQALCLSPTLYESSLFNLFDSIKSIKDTFLYEAINRLEQDSSNSPIRIAKLGKLYLYHDTISSQNHLEKAIKELPNLNRCYLYLGNIYEFKHQDFLKAEQLYYKSFCLDHTDINVHKNLCRFYSSINKDRYAEKYCSMNFSIKNKSKHNISVKAIYKAKKIDDDIFPSGYYDLLYD